MGLVNLAKTTWIESWVGSGLTKKTTKRSGWVGSGLGRPLGDLVDLRWSLGPDLGSGVIGGVGSAPSSWPWVGMGSDWSGFELRRSRAGSWLHPDEVRDWLGGGGWSGTGLARLARVDFGLRVADWLNSVKRDQNQFRPLKVGVRQIRR